MLKNMRIILLQKQKVEKVEKLNVDQGEDQLYEYFCLLVKVSNDLGIEFSKNISMNQEMIMETSKTLEKSNIFNRYGQFAPYQTHQGPPLRSGTTTPQSLYRIASPTCSIYSQPTPSPLLNYKNSKIAE